AAGVPRGSSRVPRSCSASSRSPPPEGSGIPWFPPPSWSAPPSLPCSPSRFPSSASRCSSSVPSWSSAMPGRFSLEDGPCPDRRARRRAVPAYSRSFIGREDMSLAPAEDFQREGEAYESPPGDDGKRRAKPGERRAVDHDGTQRVVQRGEGKRFHERLHRLREARVGEER